jgi:hypothetical protein
MHPSSLTTGFEDLEDEMDLPTLKIYLTTSEHQKAFDGFNWVRDREGDGEQPSTTFAPHTLASLNSLSTIHTSLFMDTVQLTCSSISF